MAQGKHKANKLISDLCGKIRTAADFRTMVIMLISRNIKNQYTWQDRASQSYLEDAGIDAKQAHLILLDLFYTKLVGEWAELFQSTGRIKVTGNKCDAQQFWNSLYQQCLDILAAGDYKNVKQGAEELAKCATGYRCLEPWNGIIANTGEILHTQLPGLRVDWGKAVNYLYDGYAMEEAAG